MLIEDSSTDKQHRRDKGLDKQNADAIKDNWHRSPAIRRYIDLSTDKAVYMHPRIYHLCSVLHHMLEREVFLFLHPQCFVLISNNFRPRSSHRFCLARSNISEVIIRRFSLPPGGSNPITGKGGKVNLTGTLIFTGDSYRVKKDIQFFA